MNVDQINKKREEISKFDRNFLEGMNVKGLKAMASDLIPGYSKMGKRELIEALIAITKPERVLAVIIPELSTEVIEENRLIRREAAETNEELAYWTNSLYTQFREVVKANWNGRKWNERVHSDISTLAYKIKSFLDNQKGDQPDGGTAFTTKLRNRTRICEQLKDLVKSEAGSVYSVQLESCLEMLIRDVRFQLSEITAQKKNLQERGLAKRKKEKATISFKPILEFSQTILGSLDQLTSANWRNVSIALAIATGRRLAEIHIETTRLEYVDKYTCLFTGQLKVKGDAHEYFEKNPSFEIPVLVDAELVVAGHKWLKDKGKTVLTPEKVNARYSKDISVAMKSFRQGLGIEHELFTYHGLREVYAQVCNYTFNDNDMDNMIYLAQILGHGRGELIKGINLIDTITPQSYNSNFNVIDIPAI